MQHWPTEDQQELAATVRRLFEREAGADAVRASIDSVPGYDEKLWSVLSEQLGVPGLGIEERFGGSGAGLAELAAVAGEVGRAAVPVPLLSTVLAAEVLGASGDRAVCEALLPGIAAGETLAAPALPVEGGEALRATRADGDWLLEGTVGHLVDGATADALVLPARADDGWQIFVVDGTAPGLDRTALSTLDLTRRQARLRLHAVPARRVQTVDPAELLERVRRRAVVLLAAEQVGGAQRCLEMATEYASARRQFGRPVGSFQAVKHLCADMLVTLELAGSLLEHAVLECAADSPLAAVAAPAAGAACTEAFTGISAQTIQVFGGVGFTWEHHAHLWFRRAHASASLFGSPTQHRDRLVTQLARSQPTRAAAAGPGAGGTVDSAAFRERVQAWLEANTSTTGTARHGGDDGGRAYVGAARDYQRRLFDAGLAGLTWPREYGGQGLGPEHELAFDRAAAGYETFDEVFTIGVQMCGPVLLALGTEQQKQRYLWPLLRADEMWCQLFSEPDAGSDLASLRTRAVRDGDGWRVTGQKVWNTYAHLADFGLLLARTDPEAPKHRGITMFVVDMAGPGVTTRPLRQITGDDEFNEVFFDDVALPPDAVVGEVGQGWQAALVMLMNERRAIGRDPLALGPPVTVDRVRELARSRGLDDDPVVRQRIAEVWVRERSLQLLGERISARTSAGQDPGPYASVGKLGGAQLAREVVALGADLAGGDAAAWDPAAEHGDLWAYGLLYAPMLSIAGGTDQIQRTIIGERLLGLPKEPVVT